MIEELKKEMLAKSQQAKTIDGELTALSFGYVYSILDKYKDKEISEINLISNILSKVDWYCNHLKNTKIVYNQEEVANYIQKMIIEFGNDTSKMQFMVYKAMWNEWKNEMKYKGREVSYCSDLYKGMQELEEKYEVKGND